MRAPPPSRRIAGRQVPVFRVCGAVGFAAAVAVALGLSAAAGYSLAVEAAVIASAVLTFLGVAVLTRAVTGRETLIYYHHEIAVLAVAAPVAWAFGGPVLGHVDATALGLGAFLCCGRVGCLLAGCCHGRTSDAGIAYGAAHVRAGFPSYLAGRKLVPVQAIEAAVVAGLVGAGAVAMLAGPPARALGIYVTGYAVARFGLELMRGDAVRRHWRGLSEAQWTSLAVALASAALAVGGVLPDAIALLVAAAGLVGAAWPTARRRPAGVLDPRHVREVARVLPPPRAGPARIAETSAGLRLSAGLADGRAHYTLSRPAAPLAPADARSLAGLIAWLRHGERPAAVVPGAAGAYHVVLDAPRRER